MTVTRKDIEHIAHLARLEVDDAQIDRLAEQVGRILQYIDKLKDADVSGVELMAGAATDTNVLRADAPHDPPGPAVTLAGAPDREDDYYTVPRTVG